MCGADAQLPADLSFASQAGVAGTGRPIVATDALHRERLLIETKFAVGLTETQPSSYHRRLPSDESGVLLVVAPAARRQSLWSELIAALPERSEAAPAPSSVETRGLARRPGGTAPACTTRCALTPSPTDRACSTGRDGPSAAPSVRARRRDGNRSGSRRPGRPVRGAARRCRATRRDGHER